MASGDRSDRHEIRLPDAPEPANPYSRAIVHGGLVYLSGIVPADLVSGELVGVDIRAQTRAVFGIMQRVLDAAGSDLASLLKVSVSLVDTSDFAGMNEVYREFVPAPYPARTTVTVAALGRPEFRVEIDVIASVR
jgi:2-iminobutanoate/2-iminopropanoate deaminase